MDLRKRLQPYWTKRMDNDVIPVQCFSTRFVDEHIDLILHFDISENGMNHLDEETILMVKDTYAGLVISIAVFSSELFISVVSVYGLLKNTYWGRAVWLGSSIVIFIYYIFVFWKDISSFENYTPAFLLCFFSWYIFWNEPRKKIMNDSFEE